MHFERTTIKMTPGMHFALLKMIKCKVGISLKREDKIQSYTMSYPACMHISYTVCNHDKKLVNAEILLSAKLQMHFTIQFKRCAPVLLI